VPSARRTGRQCQLFAIFAAWRLCVEIDSAISAVIFLVALESNAKMAGSLTLGG
jgi:hypothetical protein